MTIQSLVKEAYANAKRKGFHRQQSEIGTKIALIHSELSEALEAHRTGKLMNPELKMFLANSADDEEPMDKTMFEVSVKNTFEDELADTVIRIADLCGALDINLEAHIKAKMKYNSKRPYLHGKKY